MIQKRWQSIPCLLSSILPYLLLGLAIPSDCVGGIITETEIDGSATNNTISTATTVLQSDFTAPQPATVDVLSGFLTATVIGRGGGNDIDFYSFQATAGGQAYFDIDNGVLGAGSNYDTFLTLFDSSGHLLAYADDMSITDPLDLGSDSNHDSYLGVYTFTVTGTYYIAVSQWLNTPAHFPRHPRIPTCHAAGRLWRTSLC